MQWESEVECRVEWGTTFLILKTEKKIALQAQRTL